jgi:flagellar hook protein FlgE
LANLSVDSQGNINGVYSNGDTQILGQISLATFTNPNGLVPLGNNQWAATLASGQGAPNVPGSGVAGLLQSGATEDSNIDLTNELVNMIVAQRNYQANAQTIKTQDQVLQTLVNLR